jgi:hypothetical protein
LNTVKLIDIQQAMHNSLRATFDKHQHTPNKDRWHFQDKFELDHRCKVVKSYSQIRCLSTPVADIMYWNALKFSSSYDITIFVLRWT